MGGGTGTARVAGPARARRREPDRAEGWARALVFAAGAAAVILGGYLLHPIRAGYRLPLGPDGPVYTWLARLAAEVGFVDAPGGGPGVTGLTSALGSVLGTGAMETVSLLGPVLAAACGLAAAGLLEALLGHDPGRAWAGALLTGAFAAYLAGGWLANVAMVAVFLAALAALGVSARSWRAVAGGAGLIAAAGLTHRVFLAIGLAILGLALLTMAPAALDARRRGRRLRDTLPARAAIGAGVGLGLAFGGAAWIAGRPSVPGDTSQDGFFRRLGLRAFLLDRYRERLLGDAGRAIIPLVGGAALSVPWARERHAEDPARYLAAVTGAWAAVTAIGVLTLAITGWGPPNRVLQFAFFLPLAAAAGLAVLRRRGDALAVAGLIAAVVFVVVSMGGWERQSPAISEEELAAARIAGRVAASTPPGGPIVFLVDTRQPAAAYHLTRAGNVLRMGLPAEAILRARLVVGGAPDLAAGRPGTTGDPEHDAISRAYFEEASASLERATVLVVRAFNGAAYPGALLAGREVAPGVVILRGDVGRVAAPSPTPPGLGPGALIGLSLAAIGALMAVGWGWARWALPGAGPRAVACCAPAVGIAVAVLAVVLADAYGARPGGAGSLAAIVALAVGGYLAALRTRPS